MSESMTNKKGEAKGGAKYDMDAERQTAIYDGLSRNRKWAVDRAMEYARQGDYNQATASFVSDMSKTGQELTPLAFMILQSYTQSEERFREGLLGFFFS